MPRNPLSVPGAAQCRSGASFAPVSAKRSTGNGRGLRSTGLRKWARDINDPEEGKMISKLRGRISSAHVIALAALFVALGGSAFAAARIGTNDIKKGAVTKQKLHKNAVNSKKVSKNSLNGKDIDEKTLGAVPTAGHALSADRAVIAATASNVMSAVVGKGAEGCTLLRATQAGRSAN